jgi:hypothetical protein
LALLDDPAYKKLATGPIWSAEQMALAWKLLKSAAYSVKLVRSALVKPAIPLRPVSRSITSMSGCSILTNYRNEKLPGSLYTVSGHQDPGNENWTLGMNHQGGNRDRAPSQ